MDTTIVSGGGILDLFPVQNLIVLITPVVVTVVTWLINKYTPQWSGWITVGVVVPVVSALYALLTSLVGPLVGGEAASVGAWIAQLVYGLLAVFLNQLVIQLKQGNDGGTVKYIPAKGTDIIDANTLKPTQ